MNKGVDVKTAYSVLKDADKAGILNCCFFLSGVPTVTYQEELSSFNFLRKCCNYIHNFKMSVFVLMKYTQIYNNPTEYDIAIKPDSDDSRISVYYDYERKTGISIDELNEIKKKYSDYYFEKFKYFFSLNYYIAYANKFGLKYVKENLFNNKTKNSFVKKLFKQN